MFKNRPKLNPLRWLQNLFVFSGGVVLVAIAIAYIITPALEKESQWQAQRLCKYHNQCAGTGV